MAKLTAERLREVLRYDPATGRWKWLERTSNRVRVGDEAGCIDTFYGYRMIGVDGKIYLSANLAWLYMRGEWPPKKGVDHKDGNRLNDMWANLRSATPSEQQCNRGVQSNNSSGYKGVHFHPQNEKWRARIAVNGRQVSLGLHDTPKQAHMAYVKAAKELHGDFAKVE